MRFWIVLFFTVSFVLSSTEFEDGYNKYIDGNFKSSFITFKSLAESSDEDAAYLLANMYENGEGCEKDIDRANFWYRKSSQLYYILGQDNSARDIDKERRKIYQSLLKSDDKDTDETIRRYAQSLYNINTHKSIYFLPLSYRHNKFYGDTNGHKAQQVETEFQISIKFDFAANWLGLSEIYTAAYTQLSFWQLYEESAYFRETNYNPEFFVTFPISEINSSLFIKALRLSFEHESNGRGGEEERSWNFLSASAIAQFKTVFAELKLWHRITDATDYNPELIDYMGHGHLRLMLPYKKNMAQVILRSNFHGEDSVKVNYTYPAFGRDDLYFYIKAFSGYGESLIDYNHNINKLGIGFSVSR